MGSVFKRGDTWYYDVRVKGHRIRKRVGTSKKIAELALKDAEIKIAREEFGFIKSDISIEKLIEKFLEYNKTNNRPTTVSRYKAVTDHFREYLNLKRPTIVAASQITAEVVEGFKAFRRDQWVNPNGSRVDNDDDVTESTRRGARSRTVNLEVDGIKYMLNMAIRWGFLRENPVSLVRSLKDDDQKPVRFLSVEECHRLIVAADAELRPILLTFLHTGMRKAELENLQWRDLDLERRRISIRSKENWNPKTTDREIPISDELLGVLRGLRPKGKDIEKTYVFPILDAGRSHNWIRRELIKAAQVAGIPDLTKVHTLRHTFASHLVMQGVDLPTVGRLMGHSNIATTMIYAHLAPDHLIKAVTKLPY